MGSRLYRIECLTCHGLEGDGRGPTAAWVNPHPRDYRVGKFKFSSCDQAKAQEELKPLREDLVRTLEQGIEGTSMPAFNLLAEEEREALASYVIFLSLRGETEFATMKNGRTGTGGFKLKVSIPQYLTERAVFLLNGPSGWAKSQALKIKPGPYPAKFRTDEEALKKSVQHGKDLFFSETKTKCASCHVDYGRRAQFNFDDWGTLTRPANLTINVYRGGRRPVDLYYRIHSGINGSGMASLGGEGVLTPDDIWDVVNFVQALPYPPMRKRYEIPIQ
jgi:mono/diheme cytochrome c family protein